MKKIECLNKISLENGQVIYFAYGEVGTLDLYLTAEQLAALAPLDYDKMQLDIEVRYQTNSSVINRVIVNIYYSRLAIALKRIGEL